MKLKGNQLKIYQFVKKYPGLRMTQICESASARYDLTYWQIYGAMQGLKGKGLLERSGKSMNSTYTVKNIETVPLDDVNELIDRMNQLLNTLPAPGHGPNRGGYSKEFALARIRLAEQMAKCQECGHEPF